MNYLQIEIGGKHRGLKFNQLAFQLFCQKAKFELAAETSQVYAMFYGGLVGNCVAKGEEEDFTYEQVCDWVDELYLTDDGREIIKQVDKALTETQVFKKTFSELIEKLNQDKKKEENTASMSNGS